MNSYFDSYQQHSIGSAFAYTPFSLPFKTVYAFLPPCLKLRLSVVLQATDLANFQLQRKAFYDSKGKHWGFFF
jgi:hypothetical protein